jgi:cell wall-associated NlpC family hydrolase
LYSKTVKRISVLILSIMLVIGFAGAATAGKSFNVITLGEKDQRVKVVQRAFFVPVTGTYNRRTQKKVKAFQRAKPFLSATGRVDKRTMTAIRNRMSKLKDHRKSVYQKIMTVAQNQKGKPYVFGAAGPSAFDCSGLTQYVYNHATGISLPHHAGWQSQRGHRVSRANAHRGDLVFFYSGGSVYHTAIYAGNGYIVEAAHPGTNVKREKIWTSNVFFKQMFPRYISL